MKVIVLGAGVVGVTSAWYLAEAGHEVLVLDRQPQAGMETSFANGGQISAGHAEPWAKPSVIPKILRWLGREDAPFLFRPRLDWAQWEWGLRFLRECVPGRFERNCRVLAGLAAYSHDCLRALRERTGIAYDHLARGILHFATDARDFELLARSAEAVRAMGVDRRVKSGPECLALEPALKDSQDPIVGGVYTPGDESGDARHFTEALALMAAQRGVQLRFSATVAAIESAGGEVTAVRVGEERVSADAYVVCLGSYSPLLLRPLGIRIPVYPLKGYSITLALGPAEAAAAPSVSLTDEACKIVISRLGNRLRAAGTAELTGYDTELNSVRCAAISRRVRALFPALGGITAVENWTGLRPATPDNVPVIGRTPLRRLYLNTGHGTLGWTLACGSGKALADIVSGRRPEVMFRFQS
ncbi:MAG: amino acid dehydrogenase [Betaproteobacteria bacterium RIFCSPLOWO2_12_FULL_65_14]|nr:MAG: amino acid dehydrogenase [Betaproteobacteria bacterium RIFCSPLOWO2_12_FULL_65_14]